MSAFLPFIVIGLTSGSVYALAAMGLVVTYKTSGVFNFAHGAVAMICTFVFYSLRDHAHVPTVLAAAFVVLVVAPLIGVVIDRVLLRRLQGAPTSVYVVVSIGLLVALEGLALVIYGPITKQTAPLFPQSTFQLPGVRVGYDQLTTVLIVAAVGTALLLFFRFNQTGLAMRAVVDDPDLSELSGTDAKRVTTFSWMLGCSFAALAGVLFAPILGVDVTNLTLLVLYSFGAAAVGRLTNLGLTYVGALGIGVVGSLATKYVAHHPLFSGLPTSLPFIVLFVVLVFSPRGRFVELTRTVQGGPARLRRAAGARRFPIRVLLPVLVVAVLLPPFLTTSRLTTATATLAFVLVFASLSLLVGLSRQVSLCHAAFVVFGATTLGHLLHMGVPYVPALVLSGLILLPAAAVLAIPAIRLSGLFLALATFGFGALAQYLLFDTQIVFGHNQSVNLQRPELFGVSFTAEKSFYYFVLAVVVVGVVAIEAIRVTRLGRMLRGLADSPTAIESMGINPTSSRVLVFCVSGFLAAIAGGLLGTLYLAVSPASFDFTQSLTWIAVLVAAGADTFGGALLAAILLEAVPAFFTSANTLNYQTIFFGVGAILLAQAPNGVVGFLRLPDFSKLAATSSARLGSRRGRERLDSVRAATQQVAG